MTRLIHSDLYLSCNPALIECKTTLGLEAEACYCKWVRRTTAITNLVDLGYMDPLECFWWVGSLASALGTESSSHHEFLDFGPLLNNWLSSGVEKRGKMQH